MGKHLSDLLPGKGQSDGQIHVLQINAADSKEDVNICISYFLITVEDEMYVFARISSTLECPRHCEHLPS